MVNPRDIAGEEEEEENWPVVNKKKKLVNSCDFI